MAMDASTMWLPATTLRRPDETGDSDISFVNFAYILETIAGNLK